MCNVTAYLMWHSAGVSAAAAAAPSGVVTFLFTDVEGSTRRWESDAEGMRVALAVTGWNTTVKRFPDPNGD